MSIFSKIKVPKVKRNVFNLSHERKMSVNMGNLIPVFVQDILPGDTFKVNAEVLCRMAPMLAPIMHRLDVTVHYFFVPNRLVWDEWQDFITGGKDGTSAPVAPYISPSSSPVSTGLWDYGSLADYLGLPRLDPASGITNTGLKVSALPFRAYQLIYDEYYRDQNLQDSLDISKASGQVTGSEVDKIMALRNRAWRKDYYTSALPFAQRGPEVALPIDSTASVTYKDVGEWKQDGGAGTETIEMGAGTPGPIQVGSPIAFSEGPGNIHNIDEVDVTSTSVNMNELRYAEALQSWLEKMARGGARYIEQMFAHFGVRSSDARLQRPEFIGGGRHPMVISESLSTAQTEDIPQANMAGHGISVGGKPRFKMFFEEHGYVIGLASILPEPNYQQGVPRHFMKFDKLDYAWPSFANLGEQAIMLPELWYNQTGPSSELTEVFGYTPRYAEYKYCPSTVHGTFRGPLDFWHMGRKFASKPVLNESFVMSDPTERIFAVQGEGSENIYMLVNNRVKAKRPLPYFGIPKLV